ncbi:hypothetical protein ACIRPP_28675 [Streptomyces sp. NPDC101219]|uniref:hypothetical protein n=1 Tax=Streptomyces sp. NPDC101219 TaxID=3366131 RepID=UPI003826FE81
MLALRLTRGARPAVHLRRLLVTTASAGTGFLLLCALGHALGGTADPPASALRLAWCAAPLAATVYLAIAVARTDPATRPRPGLSAAGLGPARLMLVSAATTALACTLGSMVALLVFLHLRGDLTGLPFGGGTDFLAAGQPLPVPATVTLLALVPLAAAASVATALRPREARPPATRPGARGFGRFGAYGRTADKETFGAYARFGKHLASGGRTRRPSGAGQTGGGTATATVASAGAAVGTAGAAVGTAGAAVGTPEAAVGTPEASGADGDAGAAPTAVAPVAPLAAPSGLPWGIAVLAMGLAVEALTSPSGSGGTPGDRPGALVGLALAAIGLALAGPGLTHLCGRLLQIVRPGALRLLAGRALMAEATRIGRPLGVVSAVTAATYAMAALRYPEAGAIGPLTVLGASLVTGCTVATLLTAAVEARQDRADTTAALLLLGAPATTLRQAAALRAGALLALFGPLTVIVAQVSALPLTR